MGVAPMCASWAAMMSSTWAVVWPGPWREAPLVRSREHPPRLPGLLQGEPRALELELEWLGLALGLRLGQAPEHRRPQGTSGQQPAKAIKNRAGAWVWAN
jgi:hypothetical protein